MKITFQGGERPSVKSQNFIHCGGEAGSGCWEGCYIAVNHEGWIMCNCYVLLLCNLGV